MEEEKMKINTGGKGLYQQVISESSATQVESKKVTNMVGTFLIEGSKASMFKRVIGYSYQQEISEFVRVPDTKMASEKVTNMVGTFLNEGNNSN